MTVTHLPIIKIDGIHRAKGLVESALSRSEYFIHGQLEDGTPFLCTGSTFDGDIGRGSWSTHWGWICPRDLNNSIRAKIIREIKKRSPQRLPLEPLDWLTFVRQHATVLDVPYEEKDIAKDQGAFWHAADRTWMVLNDHDPALFSRWQADPKS